MLGMFIVFILYMFREILEFIVLFVFMCIFRRFRGSYGFGVDFDFILCSLCACAYVCTSVCVRCLWMFLVVFVLFIVSDGLESVSDGLESVFGIRSLIVFCLVLFYI